MNNSKIRKAAKSSGVPLWKLADALNVSEATMTRKLRRELPAEETAHILAIIEELSSAEAEAQSCHDNDLESVEYWQRRGETIQHRAAVKDGREGEL